jgi:hypothetical protein
MALGKRRTRRLTVNARCFRWRCDFNGPYERFSISYAKRGSTWAPDSLIVRPEEGPHRLLTVTRAACLGSVVTPRLVRACIVEAVRKGWLAEHSLMTLEGSEMPGADTRTD